MRIVELFLMNDMSVARRSPIRRSCGPMARHSCDQKVATPIAMMT
jgi:hypothetical protein